MELTTAQKVDIEMACDRIKERTGEVVEPQDFLDTLIRLHLGNVEHFYVVNPILNFYETPRQ